MMNNFSMENSTLVSASHIDWTNRILCYVILALGIIAITGNLFILFIIGKSKTLRNNLCNLLICILAISDFASGIGLCTRGISELVFRLTNKYEFITKFDCLALGVMGIFSVQMSQIVTAMIAHDRLQAVQKPFEYAAKSNVRHSIKALTLSVVYSTFVTAVVFVGVDLNAHPDICATGMSIHELYGIYWAVFAVIIATIIFFCYARTSMLLKKKLSSITGSSEKRELRKQKAILKTITIILIIYALCWCLPHVVFIITTIIGIADARLVGHLTTVLGVGIGINSGANVFIYAWKHHEIGEHIRRSLGFKQNLDTSVLQINEADCLQLLHSANAITIAVNLSSDCNRCDIVQKESKVDGSQ